MTETRPPYDGAAVAPASPANPPERLCGNCGTPAPGEYCPSCGQRQVELVTLPEWLGEVGEELVSVERGLPVTIWMLLRYPGRLTRDWLDGRRVRWMRPFRLYLFCTLVFFAATYFLPLLEPSASPGDLGDPADFVQDQAMAEQVRENTPRALFVMMPVLALLLKAGWPKAAPFIGHLIHSLHLHSMAFLVMLVFWPAMRLPMWARVTAGIALVLYGVVSYHVSLGRAYRTRWWRVLLEGPAILVVYGLLLTAVLAATGGFQADRQTDRVDEGIGAHYRMVDALAEGDTAAAERHRAEALVNFMSDPDFIYQPDARWHLGQMSLDGGQRRRALLEARQGLALDSTHLLLLGLAYQASTRLVDALEEAAAGREARGEAEAAAGHRADAAQQAAAAAEYRTRLLEAWPGEMERRGDRSYGGRHREFLRAYLAEAGIAEPELPERVEGAG